MPKAITLKLLLLLCTTTLIAQQNTDISKIDSIKIQLSEDIIVSSDTLVSNQDSIIQKKSFKINWSNLPYLFDDMSIIVGANRSGLYYTEYYRELGHINGFTVGVEDFIPVFERAFFHFGVKYARRGFSHAKHNIQFRTHNLDLPMFLSYELPAMRMYDLRLLFGGQMSFRTGSTTLGRYTAPNIPGESNYYYIPSSFNNFDFGFTFGLSAEFNDFYFRLRSFNGYWKLMPDDTSMNSSFSLEIGYFIFRKLRK
jgi:hypothetical protein